LIGRAPARMSSRERQIIVKGKDKEESDDERSLHVPGGIIKVLCDHKPLSVLIVFIPFGFVSYYCDWAHWLIFLCNFFSILPMAWLIGKSTEDLSATTGEVLGGLINATFGNIVEMLLCIAGIRLNELDVVKCTLIGSILSNLLLVMGTAFMWGGAHHDIQSFSVGGASAHSSLLLLSCLGLGLPTMYNGLMASAVTLLEISRATSVVLLVVYGQYLFFSIHTHPTFFESDKGEKEDDDSEDEDEPDLTPKCAMVILGICTILTTFCSEFLIFSIQGTIQTWHVSREFIGIIVLPIIGNAAEHWTAISMAGKNKMDLSLGVAVGSSVQMALLVTPFCVLAGWALGKPMTLDFHPFQMAVLVMSVMVASNILQDGQCNWLEGAMLFAAYFIISLIYFCEGNPDDVSIVDVA